MNSQGNSALSAGNLKLVAALREARPVFPSPGTPGEGQGEGPLSSGARPSPLPSPGVPGEGEGAPALGAGSGSGACPFGNRGTGSPGRGTPRILLTQLAISTPLKGSRPRP